MRSRGFTIILAITILMLLGALAALIGVTARGRAQDVASDFYQAQTRQLILAGLSQSPAFIASNERERQVSTPEALPQPGSVKLSLIQSKPGFAVVSISATCGRVSQTQSATFTREGTMWRLARLSKE